MDKNLNTDQPPNYSVVQHYQQQQPQNYNNNYAQGPPVQMPQPQFYPQQQQQPTYPQYQQAQAPYQPLQPQPFLQQQQNPNYGFNNNLIHTQPAQPYMRPQQQQQPLVAYNNGQPIPIRPITFDNTHRLQQMQEPVTLEKRLRENYPKKYAIAQGIILILIGIAQLGIQAIMSNKRYISSQSGIWGGLFYIATGIVTLLLNSKRTIGLLYATLVMHVIGLIIGIALLLLNLQSRYLITDASTLYLILVATGAICSALCLIKVVVIILFICNSWCFRVDNRQVNVNYYN